MALAIEIDVTNEMDPIVDLWEDNYRLIFGGLQVTLTYEQVEQLKIELNDKLDDWFISELL